jgi:asparagine synthase (glutamine-hydrolysing)
VTVALSGDGADELFGGYDRYLAIPQLYRKFGSIPPPAARLGSWLLDKVGEDTIGRIGAALPGLRNVPHLNSKVGKTGEMLRHGRSFAAASAMMTALWGPSSAPVPAANPGLRFPPLPRVAGLDRPGQLMLWDATRYLPDDILCKVDRAAMATSLETRAPFLDHRLVALAARIPTNMKTVAGESKWILRQLLYRYVPQALVDRPKSGLSVPVAAWLRGPLRDWAEELLAPDRLKAEGRFDVALVRGRWDGLMRDDYDYSGSLWPVLMFQAWEASEASRSLKALP